MEIESAYCYTCSKNVSLKDDGNCPFCNSDFVEYLEEPIAPQNPIPRRSNTTTFFSNNPFSSVQTISVSSTFNMFDHFMDQEQNHRNDTSSNDFFNTIMRQFIRPINNRLRPIRVIERRNNGEQLGDFFLGNDEQLQALADHLFRMNQQSLGSPPASKDYFEKIDRVPFEEGCCIEDTCSVCLDSFEKGSEVLILPCKHGYHKDCLEPWLKLHSECPSCRHKLPVEE